MKNLHQMTLLERIENGVINFFFPTLNYAPEEKKETGIGFRKGRIFIKGGRHTLPLLDKEDAILTLDGIKRNNYISDEEYQKIESDIESSPSIA